MPQKEMLAMQSVTRALPSESARQPNQCPGIVLGRQCDLFILQNPVGFWETKGSI